MEIDKKKLRTTGDWLGRSLFIVFGVGLGVAISLAVVDTPDEFRDVAIEGGGVGSFEIAEDDESDADAGPEGPTTRTITRGGEATAGRAEQVLDGSSGTNSQALATNPEDFECKAGENGGETDVGVTGNKIKVAANIVTDGPGASFLSEAVIGIQAVIDEANVSGICGRKIDLTTRNDSWNATTGFGYIQNYINDGTFALVVNPSSEGLQKAMKEIDDEGIPVVGSDGMLICQYSCDFKKKPPDWGPMDNGTPGAAQWLWPVATSTISTAHIMVKHGARDGAKTMGLVYDKFYKFGKEGKDAFVGEFKRLTSKHGLVGNGGNCDNQSNSEPCVIGVDPTNTNNLQTLINRFNGVCGDDACDLVAFLLEPSTALQWIDNGGVFGKQITAGPQTLFNRDFAINCVQVRQESGEKCDMVVWTGYNPPVQDLRNLPDVSKYVSSVKARNAQVDVENSFTQGAYLGARVFVEALKQVGPNLTRENLRRVLDSTTVDTDITHKPLRWSATSHFANKWMHAFEITSTPNGFSGWTEKQEVGWIEDTEVGRY